MSGVQIPPPRPLNDMKDCLTEMLANPFGINEFLNLKYLSSKGEEHYFSVTFDESSMNPRGFVQGGMITAALDQASSMAFIGNNNGTAAPLSTDLHTLFHRSLPLGEANITVKFIKIGRQIATMEARIFDENDKLVATLMHTAVNFSIPKQED